MDRKAVHMKILLFGANGQVGRELQRSLNPMGELLACDLEQVDLTDLNAVSTFIHEYKPSVIVNAAAYTAVDKAESEPERAKIINTDAVSLMANEAKKLNAWLIHYSTDYIFDGTKATNKAYSEGDTPNPLSVYGATKLKSEESILKSGCKHLIFRTSWVYAVHGDDFIKTMLRLAKEKNELRIVADQFGAPTSAELIADITALCLHQLLFSEKETDSLIGTYHLTPTGTTNWHEYAKLIITEALNHGASLKVAAENIHSITSSEYPLPAKRPLNSRLDCTKICQTFDICLPHWQNDVRRVIFELTQGRQNET